MSIKSNFPAISPSLLLDFSNTKKLDPRITFTRSSTATYFDNNGILQTSLSGIPRFDHNPITGESLGLLIEEQRTNLLTYSEQFDNAAWIKSGATVSANATTAPDGTTTADNLVENTANAVHTVAIAPSISASTTHTCTAYVKRAAGNRDLFIQINLTGGTTGAGFVWFDLSTGAASSPTVLVGTFIAVSAQATVVGNGWYRCAFTFTSNTGNTSASFTIGAYNAARSYTGDGTSGIYIWGAQLEAGSFATSYIPTVASQVTRSADAASMTGTNFSSWYNASEGTMFAEATRIGTAANRAFSVGAGSNYMYVIGTESVVVSSGATQVNLANTLAADSTYKTAMAYAINNFATVVNGGTVQTDNLGTVPSGIVSAGIGQITTGSTFAGNGAIKRIAYYPRRLSNSELQAITG